MTLSMYQASVPVFARMLDNLDGILAKAEAHAQARGIDPAILAQSRLYPDMFPLVRQVQIATDMCKGGVARLAGVSAPKLEDTEQGLGELRARVAKVREFVGGFSAAQIDGSEDRAITLEMRSGPLSFDGQSYLLKFVLPNVYFHISMTYGILRHCGVELGKMDFTGKP